MRSSTVPRPAPPSSPLYGDEDDEVTIRLEDALLSEGLADVRWLLHDALRAGARWLVVDVSLVQHLASPAVASLLSAHRTCRARGGSVVLRGANRRTVELLHRTGLWRVLTLESPRTGVAS